MMIRVPSTVQLSIFSPNNSVANTVATMIWTYCIGAATIAGAQR
jgi:hypothetical protein